MMYVGCMIVIHCNWTNIDPPTTRGKTDQSDFSSNLEEKLSAGSKSTLGLEREGLDVTHGWQQECVGLHSFCAVPYNLWEHVQSLEKGNSFFEVLSTSCISLHCIAFHSIPFHFISLILFISFRFIWFCFVSFHFIP